MRKQNHFRRFAAALLTIIMISTLCSPALAARDAVSYTHLTLPTKA